MIVAVSGSRRVRPVEAVRKEFELLGLGPDDVVVHGACHLGGVDDVADEVAQERGCIIARYPVDHRIDGPWPGAGPRRNRRMLRDSGAERLLAFPCPRSRGTKNAVTEAKKLGLYIKIVEVS